MELPKGWRVGYTDKVGPQWAQQWSEYVGYAHDESDIILEDRKSWCFPITIRRFSQILEDRANELGVSIRPVRSESEEHPWHERLTEFSGKAKADLTEKSKRMMGDAG